MLNIFIDSSQLSNAVLIENSELATTGKMYFSRNLTVSLSICFPGFLLSVSILIYLRGEWLLSQMRSGTENAFVFFCCYVNTLC